MVIAGIVGGIIVSVKKESRHKAVSIYVSAALSFLFGDLMMAVGRNVFWWSVAAAAASLPISFIQANQNAILYRKIPAAMQGRVILPLWCFHVLSHFRRTNRKQWKG